MCTALTEITYQRIINQFFKPINWKAKTTKGTYIHSHFIVLSMKASVTTQNYRNQIVNWISTFYRHGFSVFPLD